MKIFRSFFKLHQSGILAFVLCSIVFVLIFSLYDLPVGAVLYSAVLSAVICLALFLASFIRYCKRCRMLQKMQQEITVTIQHLPQPQDCKEQADRGSFCRSCSLAQVYQTGVFRAFSAVWTAFMTA